ncbi:hypothetical protein ABZZ74_53340 [Streptomyces sp. NPDC006476]|uniref:hypothetical protein n=1 Tax=Streptomyces sp. NPDC006476 TaxID=3157175 RepID=UPI0033AA391A
MTARIDYGLTQEWTQRRIGEFAGRSATVVNRRKKERERAAKPEFGPTAAGGIPVRGCRPP